MSRQFTIDLATLLTLVAEIYDAGCDGGDLLLHQMAHIVGYVSDQEIDAYVQTMLDRPDLYSADECEQTRRDLTDWRDRYTGQGG